jgi:Branched-chain amino acid transport system / permease component
MPVSGQSHDQEGSAAHCGQWPRANQDDTRFDYRIAHVPWIIIVAAFFLLIAHLVLIYTRFGRYVYMVGGNREAAEYSGVNTRLVVGAVMVISAMCSGVAGMIGVAYFGSAQQNEFDTFLLDAIAAVVVGGTSLFGGRGGIGNTIVGLFVLGVLNNGLDYVKIDSFLKILIRGLILLIALIINLRRTAARRAQSRRLRRWRIEEALHGLHLCVRRRRHNNSVNCRMTRARRLNLRPRILRPRVQERLHRLIWKHLLRDLAVDPAFRHRGMDRGGKGRFASHLPGPQIRKHGGRCCVPIRRSVGIRHPYIERRESVDRH